MSLKIKAFPDVSSLHGVLLSFERQNGSDNSFGPALDRWGAEERNAMLQLKEYEMEMDGNDAAAAIIRCMLSSL